MPQRDGRTGDIVIRIVYDGMPEAGKTTNIQQLCSSVPLQRRGTLVSPDAKGRRTEFFDWLDFAGGFVDGRRVRCQLVSVPGQPQLLHRRKYLLETADAVVFVADSQPGFVDENRATFTELLRLLDAFGREVPIATIVQANKQDLAGALRPRTLAAALEVPVTTPVVPAAAQAGRGVMDTFVLAARLATDRVRALLRDARELTELAPSAVSADALHTAMIELEATAAVAGPSLTTEVAQSMLRRRANDVERARACKLPRADSLLAGHVWPPVKGRAAVAAATAGDFRIPERAIDWAPPDPIELSTEGWLLHTSARWLFADEGAARVALMSLVRALIPAQALLPEGRSLFVAPDEGGYRLWMLTPEMPSLAEELVAALAGREADAVASVLSAAAQVKAALLDARGSSQVTGGATGAAFRSGRVLLLGLPEGEEEDVLDHLRAFGAKVTEQDAEGRAWLTQGEGSARHREPVTARPTGGE
jgi:signal recognition particle receptor subunit beta